VQQAVLVAQLLTLLAVANGTPVIAARLLGKEGATPLDGNATLCDGRPLFGSSKTLRGIILSVAITAACATLIGLDWEVGFVVALGAMIGDLFSSFVKRRLGMSASSKFIGLDQIPESLLPLLASMALLPLRPLSVAIGTFLFFVGALVLSRVFFKLNIRDRPY
jgi:CDP-2,3-bis-(O-geranylgeranyl)-sn-glycerol synthase